MMRFYPTGEDLGKRMDHFLVEKLAAHPTPSTEEGEHGSEAHQRIYSRTWIQELIEAGRVTTGLGPVRKANFRLRQLDWVEINLPTPEEYSVPAEDLPIEILYQDGDLAVVVKPSGMPTHPGASQFHGTLVNALRFHLKDLSGIGGVLRPGIVHRLDRVTSGLLVVAKSQTAHIRLSDLFRTRKVTKVYRAVCLGKNPGEKGVIEGYLDRHPTHRKKRRFIATQQATPPPEVNPGRFSRTLFERVASQPPLLGLLLYPYTGRTHQLRVHLESLGCPIVLDQLYGYDPHRWQLFHLNPLLRKYPGILLHAERLGFVHPLTGQEMTFEAPPPILFQQIWGNCFNGECNC
jgi:23S rRNA pseudouridine1911/1915/1917 synthase